LAAPAITTSAATTSALALSVTALTATAPATVSTLDYTVKAGDTLFSIALAHKVSMAAIMLANDMGDAQVVKLGQVLHIPTALTWPGESENVFWFIYIVQPGEALSSIAARFGVKMADLVRINKLADASAIRIGQKLVIPATTFAPAQAPTQAPTPPQPTARPKAAAPEPVPTEAVAAVEPPAPTVVAQAAAQPTPAPAVAPAARSAVHNVGDSEAIRARLLALYNEARNAAAVGLLGGSAELQAAAQSHAEDCAKRGYGSHQGSDGSDSRARITRAGYGGRITGENWAWGRSADEVFDMWFNQEAGGGPHRSNILSVRYAEVGFGIAAANGGFYVVANFGAP
jgi:uncharacterized protein YkwD